MYNKINTHNIIDTYNLPHNKLNMEIILQGFNQNELTTVKHAINDAIQSYDSMLGINPSTFRYIITMNKWFEPQDNKYGNTSTPYIYYNNNIVNIEVNSILYLNGVYYTNTIRHEIAHVLLTYSLDNLYLRPLFNEGIARLVEHNGKGKHELAKILFDDVYKNYSTNDILSINKHFHTIGSSVIHYLYNFYPETIKNLIYCIRKHINELECVEGHITTYFNMYNFKSWLFNKNNIHDISDTSKDTVHLIHNSQSSKDVAQYPKDYSSSNPIVKVGNLLNNHGTEEKYDDVYEANIELYSTLVYTFKNIRFYITSEPDDEKLTIMDQGKNIGFGFPKVITHLKLIKTENDKGISEYRLVPSTKDGDEKPKGMPPIPDKYRLIDPIFAHEYEKEEHSPEHVTIGLIDFSKYTEGTLFRMHHDPDDPSIKKDGKGNILKLEDTKVKLYDPNGNEVGILSGDYHHFQGEIFFSIDNNYQEGFFASYAPYLGQKILSDGTRAVFFKEGKGDITKNNYPDYKNIPIESNTNLHNKKLSTEDSASILKNDPSVNSDTTLKPPHDPDTIVFVYDTTAKQYFVYSCTDKDLNQFAEQGQDSTDIYNKLKIHHDTVHKDSISAEDKIIIYHNKSKIIYENGRIELDLRDYSTISQPRIIEDNYMSGLFLESYNDIYQSIISRKSVESGITHQEYYETLINTFELDIGTEDSANMLKDDPSVNSDATLKPPHNPDTIVFVYDGNKYHFVKCKNENIHAIESKGIDSNSIYNNLKMCNTMQNTVLLTNMTYIIYHKQSKILHNPTYLELDYINKHYNIKDQDTLKLVSDVYQAIYDNRDNPLRHAYLDWDYSFVIGKIKEAYDTL